MLYTVLRANGDQDGDGSPDAIEVFARTLPGDPSNFPDRPLAVLEQAFAAAGGAEAYAARKIQKKTRKEPAAVTAAFIPRPRPL